VNPFTGVPGTKTTDTSKGGVGSSSYGGVFGGGAAQVVGQGGVNVDLPTARLSQPVGHSVLLTPQTTSSMWATGPSRVVDPPYQRPAPSGSITAFTLDPGTRHARPTTLNFQSPAFR
jgi:hypothetical protein